MKDKNFTQGWWIRRAVYAVVTVVLLVAAGFGLIDEGQIDAVAASPILGALVTFLAAAKTNPGSDSTATAADVAAAQESQPSADDIAQRVVDGINTYGKHAQEAVTSVADYYNRHP
ncbi:hypothetical protein [Corynebacterium glyciniphilum]|uniref:hypothetical protein n=1 Tax=Corynebacterium glyciniphilum TaxID=1404244 RepID=UPI0026522C84|nr:hypothetical protein [Corynebacterium glyciniphilum]MDN6706713.1 hypothetical protein [Corynebacterium glyciniphilum]